MILEVLDQRGRVQHRVRLSGTRFSIGRAYDNDLILDDPWVDPRHLEVLADPDGQLRFQDLGSANGTWAPRHGGRLPGGAVQPGLELRIGHTLLRFIDPAGPVPPARPDLGPTLGVTALLRRSGLSVGLTAGALAIQSAGAWIETARPVTVPDLATPALATLLVGCLWAGGWSVASRVVAHRARFLAHLGWAAAIFLGSTAATAGAGWIGFLWPATDAVAIGEGAVQLGLAALLIAGHLALVAEWSVARRWTTAAVVVAAGFGIGLLVNGTGEADEEGTAAHAWSLRPLSARLIPAEPPEAFFARVADLESEVEALVEEQAP